MYFIIGIAFLVYVIWSESNEQIKYNKEQNKSISDPKDGK